jgi:hypothetical protein
MDLTTLLVLLRGEQERRAGQDRRGDGSLRVAHIADGGFNLPRLDAAQNAGCRLRQNATASAPLRIGCTADTQPL